MPDCAVRVAGAGVSKYQCSLLRTPQGLWVVDLHALEGIRVNGKHVSRRGSRKAINCRSAALFRIHYDGASGSALTARRPVQEQSVVPTRTAASALPPEMEALLLPRGYSGERAEWAPLLSFAGQLALMQQQMFDQMTQAMQMMGQMFGRMQEDQMRLVRAELDQLHQMTRDLHGLQAELLARTPRTPQPAQPREKPVLADGSRTAVAKRGSERQTAKPGPVVGNSQEDAHAALCERIADLQQERQGRWQTLLQTLLGKRSATTL